MVLHQLQITIIEVVMIALIEEKIPVEKSHQTVVVVVDMLMHHMIQTKVVSFQLVIIMINHFNILMIYQFIVISAYGMSSRNSENNTWSAPVKSSYSSLGSNSGSSSMVMNTRPDPWSNSSSREIETNVWQQRPPQPPADKYVQLSS